MKNTAKQGRTPPFRKVESLAKFCNHKERLESMTKRKQSTQEAQVSCLPPVSYQPWQERYELGRSLRSVTARSAHEEWNPPAERDMIALLEASNQGRVESLVPLRYGRML